MLIPGKDYVPIVQRVRDYIDAEMDAASPSGVVAYCESNDGAVVELTLSDLVSVTAVATQAVTSHTPPADAARTATTQGPA